MGTSLLTSCGLQWRYHHQQIIPGSHLLGHSHESFPPRAKITAESRKSGFLDGENEKSAGFLNRRSVLVSGVSLVSTSVLGSAGEGLAVVKQGLLAGRIPGLSEPDDQGWRTYRRPDDKSGGHGVGWSPIIPYLFSVPQGWEEVPVSIADLGGTEIDLRFGSSKEGRLFVIVAPVLRFADNLGENATIEQIGPPEKVINAFGPEVIGEKCRREAGNRLYLFNVTGKWSSVEETLPGSEEDCRLLSSCLGKNNSVPCIILRKGTLGKALYRLQPKREHLRHS
ncbi:PSBP DOMAIN-CONTAINING PROTEIN 4 CHLOROPLASTIC [Salix purpurea]|uniref:PSBP DOMAIN-CONTAINING PROTEIN 4 CHLOROPLASTIC n=1 Tax=Salix purpurea TaxID=77065 RepID=A0A9Q0PC41_SALPP|nr:PSBP DOMAIN-CONTAINING PROTEIN 4 CHLOROPLASTIC [Salix purpurea]